MFAAHGEVMGLTKAAEANNHQTLISEREKRDTEVFWNL